MSKIFIVSSSMRNNSNSDILAEEFARGAKDAGNEVVKVNIRDMELKYCIGCLYCQSHSKCVLKDGMENVLAKASESDVLVFATPIYYYGMAGQLKTFLDRMNPLFSRNNKFKTVYLIATAADGEVGAMDGAVKGVEGWISCFSGVRLAGTVFGGGVTDIGEVKNTGAMNAAYQLGKSI